MLLQQVSHQRCLPLVRLKWLGNCRSSSMTDFVVTGAHFGPARRADLGKIDS